MKSAFLIITFLFASVGGFAQAPASSAKPLTREQLMQLVAAGMDNARLLQTLDERGIGFELTGQDMQSLRTAGAQPALLKALAEAALVASHEPLKKDVLAHLVGAGADESKLVQAIKERGIDAPFTAEEFDTLKQLGATDTLLKTLRDFNPQPLKADQVLGLVTNGVASGRVAALVKRRGIDFNPTDEYLETLRIAGADESLLQTPRDSKPKVSAILGAAPGTVKVNPKDGLKYVWIPPGSFQMGCSPGDNECFPDEKPAHQVTLSKGFWIGQTEVTVGAYKRFSRETGKAMPEEPILFRTALNPGWGNQQMPIVNVSWDDSTAYCGWTGGRLPSEAEWEYAARAGSSEAHYGPLDEIAWYADNSGRSRIDSARIYKEGQAVKLLGRILANGNTMHEVGQKRANGFGLFDMLGNVWEWTSDWYGEKYYEGSPERDPPGPPSGEDHVLRGGSWSVYPRVMRVSSRPGSWPGVRFEYLGFRCWREVMP